MPRNGTIDSKLYLRLIRTIGATIPHRLRCDWRREWEAELRHREQLLAEWENLTWRTRLGLLWHSLGAFVDALWMQSYRWEDEMIQDLRFGVRTLLKQPGFALTAILILSLGIGANTAIFSFVNAFLLRPLPVEQPERLLRVHTGSSHTSYPNYLDFAAQKELFAGVAAQAQIMLNRREGEDVRHEFRARRSTLSRIAEHHRAALIADLTRSQERQGISCARPFRDESMSSDEYKFSEISNLRSQIRRRRQLRCRRHISDAG